MNQSNFFTKHLWATASDQNTRRHARLRFVNVPVTSFLFLRKYLPFPQMLHFSKIKSHDKKIYFKEQIARALANSNFV